MKQERTVFLEVETTAALGEEGEEYEAEAEWDGPFCSDNRNVAQDVEIAIGVCCGYLATCVS